MLVSTFQLSANPTGYPKALPYPCFSCPGQRRAPPPCPRLSRLPEQGHVELTPPPQLKAVQCLPPALWSDRPPSPLHAGLTVPQIHLPSRLYVGARVRPKVAPVRGSSCRGSLPQGPALTTPFLPASLLFFAARITTTSHARLLSLLTRRGASLSYPGTPEQRPALSRCPFNKRAHTPLTGFFQLHSVLF